MELKTYLDMTIPVWSILVSIVIGIIHIVRLTIKVDNLSKELSSIKEMMYKFLTPQNK